VVAEALVSRFLAMGVSSRSTPCWFLASCFVLKSGADYSAAFCFCAVFVVMRSAFIFRKRVAGWVAVRLARAKGNVRPFFIRRKPAGHPQTRLLRSHRIA
jgi:hypothetical protein